MNIASSSDLRASAYLDSLWLKKKAEDMTRMSKVRKRAGATAADKKITSLSDGDHPDRVILLMPLRPYCFIQDQEQPKKQDKDEP